MDLFRAVVESCRLAPIDVSLGRLLRRRESAPEEVGEIVAVTAALLSRERGRGHSCLELRDWAGRRVSEDVTGPRREVPITLPPRSAWERGLEASGLVDRWAGSGSPDEAERMSAPLVWDGGRLYLSRYWRAERRVARRLRDLLCRGRVEAGETASEPVRELFRALFPGVEPGTGAQSGEDRQAAAAAAALGGALTLISGGPGTGKTTTVVRLLALLLAAEPSRRVVLATPTGKAAARLGESVASQAGELPIPESVRSALPVTASTIHRLLEYMPRRDRFRRHAGRPLSCDVLVVDEASMVDLLTMDAVLDALSPDARLILLGDRDQLASVEAGCVFGDLCEAAAFGRERGTLRGSAPGAVEEALRASAVELKVSYRFRDRPGIGALAGAIRRQDADRALEILDDDFSPHVDCREPPERALEVLEPILDDLEHYAEAGSPGEALERLARFRILCAVRHGPWSSERLNRLVESHLATRGWPVGEAGRPYPGRPVLVTRNDYSSRLFNGDLGVCWPEGGRTSGRRLYAWFQDPGGGLRRFPPGRLPAHETAWAMTVHKSQGSELDRVVLVLPEVAEAVVNRELLYTGVTRARRHVHLVATATVLREALARRSHRASGLVDALLECRPARSAARSEESPARSEAPRAPVQLSLFDG